MTVTEGYLPYPSFRQGLRYFRSLNTDFRSVSVGLLSTSPRCCNKVVNGSRPKPHYYDEDSIYCSGTHSLLYVPSLNSIREI